MTPPRSLAANDAPHVVLVGGGHSHALVLRELVRRPLPGARVTLVSNTAWAPYSGMLPGQVAGHYRQEETHIDLERLCRAAGARLVLAEACGVDRSAGRLLLADGSALPYALLSLNIGATPRMQAAGAADHAVPVKPIASFQQRWHALLERVRAQDRAQAGPIAVAVVGGGAAGVELVLAMQWRLEAELRRAGRDAGRLRFHLVSGGATLLPAHPRAVQRRFERVLAERGITLHADARVEQVHAGGLRTAGGGVLDADEIVWATQAAAAPWLRETGLALDGAGFVLVQASLRSSNDPRVFAAGDVASLEGESLQKAGVMAVRQAPVLARNLRRALAGQPLAAWRPQRHWLALISTGDRYAVASRGPFSAAGRWVWTWKDAIDRRFMRQFTEGGSA